MCAVGRLGRYNEKSFLFIVTLHMAQESPEPPAQSRAAPEAIDAQLPPPRAADAPWAEVEADGQIPPTPWTASLSSSITPDADPPAAPLPPPAAALPPPPQLRPIPMDTPRPSADIGSSHSDLGRIREGELDAFASLTASLGQTSALNDAAATIVFIQIFQSGEVAASSTTALPAAVSTASPSAASSGTPGAHDVSVRRVQGTHWQFQEFYLAFRAELSSQLGMGDYTKLSMFSPMQTRRPLPSSTQPAVLWTRGGAGMVAPSPLLNGGTSGDASRHCSLLLSSIASHPSSLASSRPASQQGSGTTSFKRSKTKIQPGPLA